jgi:hypothetical protein
MKRGDFRTRFELLAEQLSRTFLHFAGRFIRKGDGEDSLGFDFVANEIGYAKGDDARFARASASQNQQGV